MAVIKFKPREAPVELQARIATNLKAVLDDERWSGRKAAAALGISQGYISRRTSGDTELSASDIVMFAGLLKIEPDALMKKLLELPHLDSNQEPIGSRMALVDDLAAYRARRIPETKNRTA